MYLPVERFKRQMDVTDEDWIDSLPYCFDGTAQGTQPCTGPSASLRLPSALIVIPYGDKATLSAAGARPLPQTCSPHLCVTWDRLSTDLHFRVEISWPVARQDHRAGPRALTRLF